MMVPFLCFYTELLMEAPASGGCSPQSLNLNCPWCSVPTLSLYKFYWGSVIPEHNQTMIANLNKCIIILIVAFIQKHVKDVVHHLLHKPPAELIPLIPLILFFSLTCTTSICVQPVKRNGKQLIVRQRETASNLPKKHELCSYFKQLNKLRTGTTINTWWEKQAIWMGKWIKRIQSYHKDTVRLWQTDSFRTRKKERRTVGIRVLLLILVSEGPQARPLKSSATVLSFTMSYSQFLFPSTSPFSNYVPLSLSLSLHSSLKLPFSLQGQADAVTN